MRRTTFLLAKDPVLEHGGDVTMTALLIDLARASHDVRLIAFSKDTDAAPVPDLVRVAKPEVSMRRLARRSVVTGRSLVHCRFDDPALVAAVEASESDAWVATHPYMAESFLASARGAESLVVDVEVSEVDVWRSTRGRLGRIEAPRIRRDELRVARAARSLGSYDADEVDRYRADGVTATWLDVTLPPGDPVDVASTPPRLALVGTRSFAPNQEAFLAAIEWWPRISAGIPDAELVVVGDRAAGPAPRLPAGVRDLGFVEDLETLLGTCRGLLAPVRTGGGVRVKVLHAAARGLPVASTAVGLGSLDRVLGVPRPESDEDVVQSARALLLDRAGAAREGRRLSEVNRSRWDAGVPHAAVERLLRPAFAPT